jgi:hypothetical protein
MKMFVVNEADSDDNSRASAGGPPLEAAMAKIWAT